MAASPPPLPQFMATLRMQQAGLAPANTVKTDKAVQVVAAEHHVLVPAAASDVRKSGRQRSDSKHVSGEFAPKTKVEAMAVATVLGCEPQSSIQVAAPAKDVRKSGRQRSASMHVSGVFDPKSKGEAMAEPKVLK